MRQKCQKNVTMKEKPSRDKGFLAFGINPRPHMLFCHLRTLIGVEALTQLVSDLSLTFGQRMTFLVG